MQSHLIKVGVFLFASLALQSKVHAQEISPSLKKMLGALPIAELKDDVQKMVGDLKKTSCGSGLSGCYATKSSALQLYFFTSNTAQQTFVLVINQKMAMPKLLKDNVQKVLGGTSVRDAMISISTADLALDTVNMPADLQKIVRDSYFNVNSLNFSSGVQLSARADLGGVMRMTMQSLGVDADQLTLRAAVAIPIPTDLASGAGTGAGLADALKHGDTMKKAGADALTPEAYVEFQLAPGAVVKMNVPKMSLSDTTFFINNVLTFGYKGNARFDGTSKDILLQFQTPLNPAGAMDLLDFSFRMAMPQSFTLQDQAMMTVAMAMPDGMAASVTSAALTKMGGGFVGNIKAIKGPLLTVTKPLSVFQLRNPLPAAPYKFGDRNKPFPTNDDPFNVILLGPLADGGPLLYVKSDVRILGQTMGKIEVSAGKQGFHGSVEESITIKLGPLGKTAVKMTAKADITKDLQDISLKGNVAGQKLELILSGDELKIDFSASCINPFEIKTTLKIQESMDIAEIFEGQGGVSVDPSKINKCIGEDLKKALNKVANEYSNLKGYTAKEANKALQKIADEELAAYNAAKDAAREVADKAADAANKALKDAGNAFKRIGKKKHSKGPDPKFAASVFDWDFYYDKYPDLVKNGADLATHWRDSGFNANRQGSATFHAKYYFNRYTDVQQACDEKDLACILNHWLWTGIDQGRQGSSSFSVADYLSRQKDLQKTYGIDNYSEALNHWITTGEDAGLDGSPSSSASGPVSGPIRVGGGGGGHWNDIDSCQGQAISGFKIRYGSRIDAVQFRYGAKTWGDVHGNSAGNNFNASVSLASNEYIVQVNYAGGDRVDSLSFKSNLGKTYGPYGGDGGGKGTYKVTPGEKLGCVSGRSGEEVDQIVFSSTGLR